MGLGPMEISGSISRLQDFASIKHNEENRVLVNQTTLSGQLQKQVDDKLNTVERGSETNNGQKKFDAKEKGSNEYSGDGGKKRGNSQPENRDGVVRPKGLTSSFDIRI